VGGEGGGSYSGHGSSAVCSVEERRNESLVVKGEADRWVLPDKFKRIQNPNLIQFWFDLKVALRGLKKLNKNTRI
jgi:hypothetical protein